MTVPLSRWTGSFAERGWSSGLGEVDSGCFGQWFVEVRTSSTGFRSRSGGDPRSLRPLEGRRLGPEGGCGTTLGLNKTCTLL